MNTSTTILLALSLLASVGDRPPTSISASEDCLSITKYVSGDTDSLGRSSVRLFLQAFSDDNCVSNVEFTEWGNEVLFALMDKQPALLFKVLFSLPAEQFAAVKEEIAAPINDGINVIAIFSRLQSSKLKEPLKTQAIALLHPTVEAQKALIEDWEKKNKAKWTWPE